MAGAQRHYLFAGLVTLAIVLPRSISIQQVHCESWDDQYHLARGMFFWTGKGFDDFLNDPPLGEGIVALPMLMSGCRLDAPAKALGDPVQGNRTKYAVLYGQKLSPESLLQLIAIWKSILFLPGALLVFHVCRTLYGIGSAWLALAMLMVDPNFAAHTPVAALDVLAAFAILAAAWAQWQWSLQPTKRRLVLASFATSAALLIKHSAIILPPLGIAFALMNRPAGEPRRKVINRIGAASLLTVVFIWPLTLFDISRPVEHCRLFSGRYSEHWGAVSDLINPNLERYWPAGIYVASLVEGVSHVVLEPRAWLWGQHFPRGVWYYYPVIAMYKVPVGIGLILLVGSCSLAFRRWRREEWMLAAPFILYSLVLLTVTVQIGFRYALPGYLLAMMLASRCLLPSALIPMPSTSAPHPNPLPEYRERGRYGWRLLAWGGVAFAAVNSFLWHPNYLSYVNWPRDKVWLRIGDSNLDWGQSLKQVRDWIEAHAAGRNDVFVMFDGDPSVFTRRHYLDDRAIVLPDRILPDHGLLIISPIFVSGADDIGGVFASLRPREPKAIVGDCMLVYDLDHFQPATNPPESGK
jgi:4-amino-4-deoxy-L-arabinose transferase-like glycosyltransferase